VTGEAIGRERETDDIEVFLDRPARGLRTLVLDGEAGIGKSTLWAHAVEASRARSLPVLASRPAEGERSMAHVVLGDLFGECPADLLSVLPAPRRRAFEAALLRVAPDERIDPRALGAAIQTLLSVLTKDGPLVLAIDDDQWMDPSSAATLEFALRRSLDLPILLLLARRTGVAPATALEQLADPAGLTRLRIGPLSVGAIQLILARGAGITLPRPVLIRLHEASGGNPFYALELARSRSQDPSRDANQPWAVPDRLERLVAERLGRLDDESRAALLYVAAAGRLALDLVGSLGVAPDALEAARAANVIETKDGTIRFSHPLLAAGVYQAATGRQRRAAHLGLATIVGDPVERAQHLALGTDLPDARVAVVLDAAVEAAKDRGATVAAAALADQAIRLTPPDAEEVRLTRAVRSANAHLEVGDGNVARSIADELIASDVTGRWRAEALFLSGALTQDGPRRVEILREALRHASAAPALRVRVHADLAATGRFFKDHSWTDGHARAALRLAERLDDDAVRADALSIVACIRFDGGDPEAPQLAEEAYRLARSLGDAEHLKWAGWAVSHVLAWSAVPDRARAWLERELAEWGDRDETVRTDRLFYLSVVEVWAGRWDLASEYARESHEISLQYGLEGPPDFIVPGLVALHRGDLAAAREHARHAQRLGEGHLLSSHVAILAICELWDGRPAEAVAGFIDAEQTSDARGAHDPNWRWWRAEYSDALLRLGRIDEATALIRDWEAVATRLGRDWSLAHALRSRGVIAAARGDLVEAVDLLERAAERHDQLGDPFGRGRALLALGIVNLRTRQKRAARIALDAALATFEALGAASWATATRLELARVGGRTRIRGLSPSEQRVAVLVAEGRTNREIASTLFLGERTVSSHLTNVYAKLGLRSRTELARHLLPHSVGSPEDPSKSPTS
jgi:DNA-binding CsgD family transcriptional regulator